MAGDRVSKVVVGNSGRQESDVDVKKEEERSLFAIGGGTRAGWRRAGDRGGQWSGTVTTEENASQTWWWR